MDLRSRISQVRLPAPLVAGFGVFLLVGVILYGALAHAPFAFGLLALALLGACLQIAAPYLDRPRKDSATTSFIQSSAIVPAKS